MNMKRIIAAVVTASIIGGAAGSGMQMINAEELGPHFTVPHKELKSSGSYDSVSWTIDEEGTLTISGTGYLPNNLSIRMKRYTGLWTMISLQNLRSYRFQ